MTSNLSERVKTAENCWEFCLCPEQVEGQGRTVISQYEINIFTTSLASVSTIVHE